MKHVHLWVAAMTSALVWPCAWYWMILNESAEERERTFEIGAEPFGLFTPFAPLLFVGGVFFATALLYRIRKRQQLNLYHIGKSWFIGTAPFACIFSLALHDFMIVPTLFAISLMAAFVAWLSLTATAFAYGRISPKKV